MEDFNVVDATESEVVTGQENTEPERIESVTEEVAPSAIEKPVQGKEENAKFAELRRKHEAEVQAAKDSVIARMYGDQGIFTEAELEEALAEQAAEEKGLTTEEYSAMQYGLTIQQKEAQKQADIDGIIALASREGFRVEEIPDEILKAWNNGEGGRLVDLYKSYTSSNKEKTYQEQLAEKDRKIAEYEKALNIQKANETNAQASTGGVGGNGINDTVGYISEDMFEKNRTDQKWVMKNLPKIAESRKTWYKK